MKKPFSPIFKYELHAAMLLTAVGYAGQSPSSIANFCLAYGVMWLACLLVYALSRN